jgi:hypothetical protein
MVATQEEREGIKMIQALQALVGKGEPEEKALRGWRGMSEWERQNTRAAYAVLFGK